MTWFTVAGVVGGALISSQATRSAADKQSGATGEAIGEQARQYDQTRTDLTPWREGGQWALGQLQTGLEQQPTAEEVMAQPGYQFGATEGQRAIDRMRAAQGGRASGAALKRASMFATDYASTKYGEEYARRNERLTRLAQMAGLGGATTTAGAAEGRQTTNAISGLMERQGDAAAGATLQQGGIWGNAANELGAYWSRNRRPAANTGGYGAVGNTTWSDNPASDPYYWGP